MTPEEALRFLPPMEDPLITVTTAQRINENVECSWYPTEHHGVVNGQAAGAFLRTQDFAALEEPGWSNRRQFGANAFTVTDPTKLTEDQRQGVREFQIQNHLIDDPFLTGILKALRKSGVAIRYFDIAEH